MALTVYVVRNASGFVTLDATTDQTAQAAISPNSPGIESGAYGGLLEISQDRSTTKSGATRVMIKASIKTPVPATSQGETSIASVAPITVHTVMTVSKPAMERIMLEQTGVASDNQTVSGISNWLVWFLTALVADNTLPEAATSSPLVRALTGGMPINVQTGTYGTSGS